MYGYIITATIAVLIGLCLGWWLGSRSYSSGLVDGVNMMHRIYKRQREESEEETGHTPWFHGMDVRDAVDKMRGEE